MNLNVVNCCSCCKGRKELQQNLFLLLFNLQEIFDINQIVAHLYVCHPLPFLQYSSIPHLQNYVFNKHWEYFKISKSPILTRSIKLHTLQFPLNVYEKVDPFFFIQLITQLIWGSLEVSLIQTQYLEQNWARIGPTHTKVGPRIETLSS